MADIVERLRRATLGEFEIGRELGRGGMAAVFLAHEIALDRKVAIKVMAPGLLLGDGMVDRFRHEAITIAHLHHPNIVSVYSVRQAEGLHYFVMRYVPGRSLEHVVQTAGRLPLSDRPLDPAPGRLRAALRPPLGRHPPGHQAGQHPDRPRRQRGRHRLRHRQGGRRGRATR